MEPEFWAFLAVLVTTLGGIATVFIQRGRKSDDAPKVSGDKSENSSNDEATGASISIGGNFEGNLSGRDQSINEK